ICIGRCSTISSGPQASTGISDWWRWTGKLSRERPNRVPITWAPLHKQIGARDEFATALIRALIEKVVVYPRVGADPIAFEIKVSSRLHWISPVKGWLVPRRTPSLSGKLL